MPPSKVKSSQDSSEASNASLVDAIEKLTSKIDTFGVQLRENSVMVTNITRLVQLNTFFDFSSKVKMRDMEKEMPRLVKENEELKERVTELERYKRCWNLKIHGLKEKVDENTRDVVMSILSELVPQWETSMESIVDILFTASGEKKKGEIVKLSSSLPCDSTGILSGSCPKILGSA